MNKTWKHALLLAVIGLAVGLLISWLFTLMAGGKEGLGFPTWMNYLLGALQGALAMGSTVVYAIDRWSVTRCTVTHFVIVFGGYTALGLIEGWMRLNDSGFWIMTAVMVAVYFAIWLIMYLSYRRKIRKMNDELKRWKETHTEE